VYSLVTVKFIFTGKFNYYRNSEEIDGHVIDRYKFVSVMLSVSQVTLTITIVCCFSTGFV